MDSEELLVTAVLGFFVLFGIFNIIATPILTRKFYRLHAFTEEAPSALENIVDSLLLDRLDTKQLYRGVCNDLPVLHAKFKLRPVNRFTFSKNKRKQLQVRWSVTIVPVEHTLSECLLLPKTDPGTVMLMISEAGVDLAADDEIDRRYFLRTENSQAVSALITTDIREFLIRPGQVYIEVLKNVVIIKRTWPTERFDSSVLGDMQSATVIAQKLATEP